MTTLDKMLQGLANALGASLSTLTTTAKTVVGAINELKSGLTAVTDKASVIGSGSLDTTNKTLIGAVNELNGSMLKGFGNRTRLTTLDTRSTYTFTPTSDGILNCYNIGGEDGGAVWVTITAGGVTIGWAFEDHNNPAVVTAPIKKGVSTTISCNSNVINSNTGYVDVYYFV